MIRLKRLKKTWSSRLLLKCLILLLLQHQAASICGELTDLPVAKLKNSHRQSFWELAEICVFLCSQLHHLVKQYFCYFTRQTLTQISDGEEMIHGLIAAWGLRVLVGPLAGHIILWFLCGPPSISHNSTRPLLQQQKSFYWKGGGIPAATSPQGRREVVGWSPGSEGWVWWTWYSGRMRGELVLDMPDGPACSAWCKIIRYI